MNKNTNGTANTAGRALYEKWTRLVNRLSGGMTAKERILLMLGLVFSGMIAVMATDVSLPLLGEAGSRVGIGYLIADSVMLSSGKYAIGAYVALMIDGIRASDILRPILLTLAFAIKLLPRVFTASKQYTVSSSVAAATVYSIFSCIIYSAQNGLTDATLPAALTVLLLPPALTAILSGFFVSLPISSASENSRIALKSYRALSACAFLSVCVLAARGHYFLGCSVASLFALFFTALVAVRGGALKGGAVGLLLGAVYSADRAISFCAVGVATGVFSTLGVTAAVGLGVAAGCIVAVYTLGYAAFRSWIPEAVIAAAIASPLIRYNVIPDGFPITSQSGKHKGRSAEEKLSAEKHTLGKQHLYGVSEAFAELSEQQYDKNTDKNSFGIRSANSEALCHRLCHGFCDTCPMVCICWNGENSAAQRTVEQLISDALTSPGSRNTYITRASAEGFKCIRYPEFKREITRLLALENAFEKESEKKMRGELSEDLGYISRIIKNVADGAESETRMDEEASEKARKALRAVGIPFDELTVFGERSKTVVAYGIPERLAASEASRLCTALSKACGTSIGAPTFSGGIHKKAVFESAPEYTAETAYMQRKKKGESCNGDAVSDFSVKNGFHYSMICDGMGSGAEAAEAAGITASFTEKLLRCNIAPELAARISGSVLRKRDSECFSTLDLFAADLMEGKAVLIKSGAPASYLVRENDVKRITASTLPLGITPEAAPRRIPINLKDGDTVVLVSDGITRNEEDGEWLYELLIEHSEEGVKQLAELILSRAVSTYSTDGESPFDDMTVSVTRIQKCG